MPNRRVLYFVFQGLFMAVLVLLLFFQKAGGWGWRLAIVAAVMGGGLVALRLVSEKTLASGWFPAAVFMADAGLAAITLHWRQPGSAVYLMYFLVIFGTALTRNARQSVAVGVVVSVLYLLVGWSPRHGFPAHEEFWLRFILLIVITALLAILAQDSETARRERERQYNERLVQVGRLATLGQVAGEVAHRIKGPLTTIMVNAEVLSVRHAGAKDILKELQEIRDEAGRCKEILKDLLDLGRIEEMDLFPIDLREPLRLAAASLESQMKSVGARLELSGLEQPAPASGDHSLIQEAVAALLQNSIEAAPKFVRVSLEGRPRSWAIAVEDDGRGIAGEDLERVFQPFFTTKPQGSGLGLSAALRIAEKHGGTIEVESGGPGRGARFTLLLPRA